MRLSAAERIAIFKKSTVHPKCGKFLDAHTQESFMFGQSLAVISALAMAPLSAPAPAPGLDAKTNQDSLTHGRSQTGGQAGAG